MLLVILQYLEFVFQRSLEAVFRYPKSPVQSSGSLVSSQSYTECHEWLTFMYASQSCASQSLLHWASSTTGCLFPSAYVFVLDGSTHHLSLGLLTGSLSGFVLQTTLPSATLQTTRDTSGIPPSASRLLVFFPGDTKTTLFTFRGTTT